MKILYAIAALASAGAAEAHDSFIPHHHPHDVSWLPDTGTFGVAALVLAVGVIAYAQFRRG
jgi:hypothetical protein